MLSVHQIGLQFGLTVSTSGLQEKQDMLSVKQKRLSVAENEVWQRKHRVRNHGLRRSRSYDKPRIKRVEKLAGARGMD